MNKPETMKFLNFKRDAVITIKGRPTEHFLEWLCANDYVRHYPTFQRLYNLIVNRATRYTVLLALALALTGCSVSRLATPKFKPPMPQASTTRQEVVSAPPLVAPPPSVILVWDSAGGTGPLTYSVHWGLNPRGANGSYANVVTGIPVKTYTATGLIPGATYYFAATAVDSLGISSPFSNEAVYTVPAGGGTAVIVLRTGPTVQGPWSPVTTNSVPVTSGDAFFNQEIRLTK